MTLVHPRPSGGSAADEIWSVGLRVNIGRIIDHNGREVESLLIRPQGIAHVVSEEPICVPDGYCAFAHVLTRSCNEGLLTLNIGVIDPGWNNYISTSVLNFSAESRLLQKGQPFMRLTFHEIKMLGQKGEGRNNDKPEDYLSSVKVRAAQDFGKYFLNVRALIAKASQKETQRIKDTSLKYLPIGAFGLTIFALLVSLGVGVAGRLASQSGNAETNRRLDALDGRLEQLSKSGSNDLERRLEALERRLDESHRVGTEPAKMGNPPPEESAEKP